MANNDEGWFIRVFNKKTKKWEQRSSSGMSKKAARTQGKAMKKDGVAVRIWNFFTHDNEQL